MKEYLFDDAMVNELEDLFRKRALCKVAKEQSKYMEGLFSFFGVQAVMRRSLQDAVFSKYPISDEATLLSTMDQLWREEEREYQYAGCDLAEKYLKKCTLKSLTCFEELIRKKSWWDTVDMISSKLVGSLLIRYPEEKKRMDRWIEDPEMWIRRAALLFQLKYKEKTDEKVLFSYCLKTMHEKEMFIRKAIGWALREHSKTSPDSVKDFIHMHRLSLSPLSIREGMKHLNSEE
jgi:3-methyladenine DNA glycosylase AlkD